jgi:hypothetical protein
VDKFMLDGEIMRLREKIRELLDSGKLHQISHYQCDNPVHFLGLMLLITFLNSCGDFNKDRDAVKSEGSLVISDGSRGKCRRL